jgi:hypothetical protein
MVGFKRLFLKDLTPDHLLLMNKAVDWGVDVTTYFPLVLADHMRLYEVEGGLIGIVRRSDCLFIEFVIGKGLIRRIGELLPKIQALAPGLPIECQTHRRGLIRIFSRVGFLPKALIMRL